MELQNIIDNIMCWLMTHVTRYIHWYMMISFTTLSTAAMVSGFTTMCAWPGRELSVTKLTLFWNFLLHSYIFCNGRHVSPYCTFILLWISVGLIPSLHKKKKQTNNRMLFFGACCRWCNHFYTAATPSCNIPALCCHLLTNLQTMSITVTNF